MLEPEVSVGILIVIVIGIIYLVLQHYKRTNIVEGLDNKDKSNETKDERWHLPTAGDSTSSFTNEMRLNLKENKDDYAKIIENLDTHIAHVQLKLMHEMTKAIATNPTAEETIATIKKSNTLSDFRHTLLNQMNYIQNL